MEKVERQEHEELDQRIRDYNKTLGKVELLKEMIEALQENED
jgi:hypothetical protein